MQASKLIVSQNATADAGGSAAVVFYPKGGTDWVVTRTGLQQVTAATNPAQPTARAYLNGIFQEGSASGSLDTSDSRFVLNPGDEYGITWTGAQPGATLTATLNVIQYPAGSAPLE